MSSTTPIPPLPYAIVMRAPECASLTVLEMGAIWFLVDAFWQSRGIPMPNDEASLSALARCHTRRWHDIRNRVLPVWQRLQPRLTSVYAKTAPIAAKRASHAAKARAAKRIRPPDPAKLGTIKRVVDVPNARALLVPATREKSIRNVANSNANLMTDSL